MQRSHRLIVEAPHQVHRKVIRTLAALLLVALIPAAPASPATPAALPHSTLGTTAALAAAPNFTPRPFGDGGGTSSLAVGDLNGDGRLDVVADSHDVLAVYLGDGTSGFAAPRPLAGGERTSDAAVGDLNGDGSLDIVASKWGYPQPRQNVIYVGDGRGGFSAPRPFGPAGEYFSVDLWDLNGDGALDIFIDYQVFLNDGQGNFPAATVFGPGRPWAVGDLDGDGDLDVVSDTGEQFAAYLNDGHGGFGPPSPIGGVINSPSEAMLGDLDGDGDLDLVAAMDALQAGERSLLFFNDGSGHFSPGTPFGELLDTFSGALGDMNGDGSLDIVLGNNQQQGALYLNDGVGNFTTPIRFGGEVNTYNLALADMNGDGALDIVAGNGGAQSVVYLNDTAGDFSIARPFGGSDSFRDIALGDFNGDGAADLAGMNVIYFNDGQGAMVSPRPFGDQARTFAIATGDLNGDGRLDLVAGNFGSPSVVYLGDGQGNFPVARPFGAADHIESLAIGDVNGDGKLDLVAGAAAASGFFPPEASTVYLGDGQGNLASAQTFGATDDARALALGDLDGDGDLDLVAGNGYNRGQSRVYLNDGQGSFGTPRLLGGLASIGDLELGDLNGDGALDIAVANNNGPSYIYLNDGQANFTAAQTFGDEFDTEGVALGDLNGDGKLDILAAPYRAPGLIYLNDGAGGFPSGRSFGVGASGSRLAIRDLNGDGAPDILAADGGLGEIYLNDGAGGFAVGRLFSGAANTFDLALGDLNGDGKLDLVAGNSDQPSVAYLGDGQGNFAALPFGSASDTRAVALGDLNGDGRLDIVAGNAGSQTQPQQSVAYVNDGLGGFTAYPFGGMQDFTQDIALGDLNGDGKLDLVAGHWQQPSAIFLGDGLGGFGPPQTFGGDDATRSVALGDLNGDGKLDILAGNDGFGNHSGAVVYLNDGQATFDAGHPIAGLERAETLTLADLNGDGTLDIAAGVMQYPSAVYLNDGQGNFGAGQALEGSNWAHIAVADVNRDGAPDVVAALNDVQSRVYLNDGQGGFGAGQAFGNADTSRSLAAGDLNGDGAPDIVSAGWTAPGTIYLNDGQGGFPTPSAPLLFGRSDNPTSVAVGDMDGDGDLDLVVGSGRERSAVYLNDGQANFDAIRRFGGADLTLSVAVGDLNGDGALDIVAGNLLHISGEDIPTRVYLNDGQANFAAGQTLGGPEETRNAVIGDLNGDGALDIVIAHWRQPGAVYLNDGQGNFPITHAFGDGSGLTEQAALGDLNGDGALDIVTGQSVGPSAVYLNDGQGNFGAARPFSGPDETHSVAVGDLNGDGALDIVAGNEFQQSVIYLNDGAGNFTPRPFGRTDRVSTIVVGDLNGDGALDIAAGNTSVSGGGNLPSVVYLNDRYGNFPAARSFGESNPTEQLALADLNGDGALDIAAANRSSQSQVYLNSMYQAARLPNNPPTVSVSRPGSVPDAGFYSTPEILSSRVISVPYALSDPEGEPAREISATYSLDGGGSWRPAVAASGTITTNLQTNRSLYIYDSATMPRIAIPDLGTATATIAIPDQQTITDLDVTLTISHTRNIDLQVALRAPDGTTIALFGGLSGQNVISTTLDDEAAVPIASGSAPFTGRFQPQGSLSAFDGKQTSGTWTLVVSDTAGGDIGYIAGWSLELRTLGSMLAYPAVIPLVTPIAIPDPGSTTSTIVVPDGLTISDLDVTLTISHTYDADLIVELQAPDGTTVELFSRVGQSGDDFIATTLDDEASIWINGESAPFTGRFHPEGNLSDFDGRSAAGGWKLIVVDDVGGDAGAIVGWRLDMQTSGGPRSYTSAALPIPDPGSTTVSLPIAEPLTIGDLDVTLTISHTNNADLQVALRGPDGTTVELFGGLSGQHVISSTLDDEATTPIASASAPYNGRFQPQGSLSAFDGKSTAGTWTLVVSDTAAGESGSVVEWHMSIRSVETPFYTAVIASSPALPIPDLGAADATFAIRDDVPIGDLDVTLTLSHTNDADLRALLQGPDGTTVELFNAVGGGGDGFIGTTLDDESSAPIATGSAPFSGRFQPQQSLSAFDGKQTAGTWTLRIADSAGGAAGTLVAARLTMRSSVGQYVYAWDTFASGVFGQSDNVVFRLVALPGSHMAGGAAGPYRRPYAAATTFPFRLRGTQVRVTQNGAPQPGALVYRLPAGQGLGGAPIGNLAGAPFTTDALGFLRGRGALAPGDRLLALVPISHTATYSGSYTLYATNGTPTELGVDGFSVAEPGVQSIEVSAAHPLILFDLNISLEWDASSSPSYLQQLEFNLQRASQYLYDFSNGQIALGSVIVHQNADNWAFSDVVVHATNRLRPYAVQGGVVLTPTLDPQHGDIVYETGQVHMGASWNRYGTPGQNLGDDWAIILAHELSHYLLFQDDAYLGIDPNGFLVAVGSCTGSAMGDLYSNPDNSEFIADQAHWNAGCANTLSQQTLGRTEWQTIRTWYPQLNAPPPLNPGPGTMPFDFTSVAIQSPITPTLALADPTFYLDYSGGQVSSNEARAFLERDGKYVIDLGNPAGGQNRLLAQGAQPGDRVCVFDRPRQQYGCEAVALGDDRVALERDASWTPVIRLTPVTSRTFDLAVDGLPEGLVLQARLFPEYGQGGPTISLIRTGNVYQGMFSLDDPTLAGHIQVWVDEAATEENPRRETIVAFTVGGNPGHARGGGGHARGGGGHARGGGGHARGGGGHARGGGAPLISPDGQMVFFAPDPQIFQAGQFYTIQGMAALPLLPPGKSVIGQGYNLVASVGTPLITGSVSFQYLGNDVLVAGADEQQLTIHFWNGSDWHALPTVRDGYFNLASARSQGPGVYALLAGITTPQIVSVSPSIATNDTPTMLTITGGYFLPPAQVALIGPTSTYTLPVTAVFSTSVTAVVTAGLEAREYQVVVINGDGGLSPTPGTFALYSPSSARFYDFFESGPSKWILEGDWGIAILPDGNRAITDSPAGNYDSAIPPSSSRTTRITSQPFSLDGLADPLLTFRHDYVLAKVGVSQDIGRVEITTDGGTSWTTLASFSGGGIYGAGVQVQDVPAPEWANVSWKQVMISLRGYTGTVRLRFSLNVDETVADKGWVIDDVVVQSEAVTTGVFLPIIAR